MGNSSEILNTNYDGLATQEEAEIYFSLMPAMRYPYALEVINKTLEIAGNVFEELKNLEEEYSIANIPDTKPFFYDSRIYNREFLKHHAQGKDKNTSEKEALETARVKTLSTKIVSALGWRERGKHYLGWDPTDDSKTVGVTKAKIYLEEKLEMKLDLFHHITIRYLSEN